MKRILSWIPAVLLLLVSQQVFAFGESKSWSAGWENEKVFIENRGQFPVTGAKDPGVLYAWDNGKELIYFRRDGFFYDLMDKTRKEEAGDEEKFRDEKDFLDHEKEEHRVNFRHDRIGITWANANPSVQVTAEGMTGGYFNYQVKENGQSYSIDGAHGYTKLSYKNLYPQIDLVFEFHPQDGIKYTIIVHPGGNPALVQMLYSGMKKLNLSPDGNLKIGTLFGDIVDHAPVTYYEGNPSAVIGSRFVKNGKRISFMLDAYDSNRTIIIDPWQSTSSLGFGNSNKIWECEHDNTGNSYFWGGDSPMKLKKYNAAGAIQWTFTSAWDTANFWVGTMITDNAGNSYCTGGSNGEISKVNTSGSQVWYNNPNGVFGPLFEYWHLSFNCDQTQLIIGGMRAPNPFSISNYRGVVISINMGSGAVVSFTPVGWVAGLTIKEVRSLCSAPNGNYYFMTLDSIGMVNSSLVQQWKTTSGYNFGYGIPSYGVTNQGISAIRANSSFIYTQDGNTIDKRSTSNGSILASAAIPGGISLSQLGVNTPGNSGLDLDSCGNVYVGSGNSIIKYDANLNVITTVSTPSAVYDVSVSKNGEVVACGNGFIGTYNMSACGPMQAICVTNTPLSATSTQVNVNCNGQCTGSATVSPAGGSGTYTYSWAPSGGTGATASSLCAGTYTCTISDGSSSTTVSVTITQPSAITASASSTSTSCTGNTGTATATASGGTGTLSYSWAPSGGNAATANNLAAGTYTCTITDANGCSTTVSATVTASGAPTVSLQSSSDLTCFGAGNGSATVSASGNGPFTYSWSPSGGAAATASNLAAGTYTCTITDTNGCTAIQSVTIIEPAQVTGSISSTPANCGSNDGTATVTATGGTGTLSYSWSPSGGSAATATSLAAGGYTVTITDANGCSNTASVTVTSVGGPSVSLQSSTDLTCFGSGNGAATVSASGNGPFTYSWSPSGGAAATAGNLAAGSYTCTITDSNGCISTQTVSITEPLAVGGTTSAVPASCGNSNGSASVTASGGSGSYTYSWAPSGGSSATASNLAAGSYTVTITDSNGCTGTASVSVSNSNGPAVSLQSSSDVTCFGGSNGSATVSASGNGPFTYSWSPTGGTNATASNLGAGSYTCSIMDANGCVSLQAVTITQPSSAVSATSVSSPEDCGSSNGTAAVTASGGTPAYTYAWSTGGTAATENNLSAGSYTCIITDASGCSTSQVVIVGGTGSATANAGNSVTITQGQSTTLNGSGGGTYVWSPSTGLSCTNCASPAASPSVTTVYLLTVTDTNGCTATDTVTVYVDIACGELYLPNAFSPNGDNENDVLYVRGNCIKYLQFEVYNRWGEQVFSTTDPSLGWDGSWRGKPCEAAVFSYVLRATLLDGTTIEKQGSITLVK